MQLHDILLLRTSAILPEAISAGGLTPTTDTSLFLTTYRGGSRLSSDIIIPRETPGETLLPESFSTGFPGFLCSICNITLVFLYVNKFFKI